MDMGMGTDMLSRMRRTLSAFSPRVVSVRRDQPPRWAPRREQMVMMSSVVMRTSTMRIHETRSISTTLARTRVVVVAVLQSPRISFQRRICQRRTQQVLWLLLLKKVR